MRTASSLTVAVFAVLAACGGNDSSSPTTVADSSLEEASALEATADAPTAPTLASTSPPPIATAASSTSAPDTGTPVEVTTADTVAPPTAAPVVVTLIDPGAEPREALRYEVTAGTTRSTLTQIQTIEQSLDGRAVPGIGTLEMIVVQDADVEQVAEGFRVTNTVIDARLGDATAADMAATIGDAITATIGMQTIAVIDALGRTTSVDVVAGTASEINEQVAASVGSFGDQLQMALPLPEEPVGVGARWRVEQEISANGIGVAQTLELEVLSITGTVLELRITGTQSVPLGPVDMPGLPPGAQVTIDGWTGEIAGTSTIDLTNPIPTSELRIHIDQQMSVDDGSAIYALDQQLTTEMTLVPG